MKAKWIWNQANYQNDEYCEFISEFNSTTGSVKLNISADSNYAIYLNGRYIEASQYASFPYEPVMDSLNLKAKKGHNILKILVHYNGGETFSTYYKDLPGLYFELYENNELILVSDENVKSHLSVCYQNHLMLQISPQLGYTFAYDAKNEVSIFVHFNTISVF